MHAPAQVRGEGLSWVGNGLWYALQPFYRIAPNPSFSRLVGHGRCSSRRRSSGRHSGVPRETTSLCPTCTREARQCRDGRPGHAGRVHQASTPAEIPAQIIERDGKILMVKDCPTARALRGRAVDRPGVLQEDGRDVPGGGHPGHATDGMHEHGLSALRYGRGDGADGGPDQPLQHDVRPVLHRRQPGGLRPRARVGRDQGHPRPRGGEEAAAPDVGAVLGRRADALAALPQGRGVLQGTGLQQHAGGDQRHRVRQGPRVLPQGGRGGSALRLPAV